MKGLITQIKSLLERTFLKTQVSCQTAAVRAEHLTCARSQPCECGTLLRQSGTGTI